MLVAVNQKHPKYKPTRYMLPSNLRETQRREPREPMTGDQVFQSLQHMGYPLIDIRPN